MTATLDRFSVRELQAAALALTAGEFAAPESDPTFPTKTIAERGSDRSSNSETFDQACSTRLDVSGRVVRVLSGHSGAGASTVALALAEAATESQRVRLLDAASPVWSGLVAASSVELGSTAGWRRGRRSDRLVIDRVADHARTPDAVPPPRPCTAVEMTVLDVGWTWRELAAHPHGWLARIPGIDIMVTRPTATALNQTEAVLAASADMHIQPHVQAGGGPFGAQRLGTVLVVVGARRWSRFAWSSLGPEMRRLSESDAVTFVPEARHGTRHGTGHGIGPGGGPDPLPRQLVAAGHRLERLLGELADAPWSTAEVGASRTKREGAQKEKS